MRITQVKETCIYVKDLAATEEFYTSILDFPVIGVKLNRHVFFRAGTSVLLCFNPDATKAEEELPPHYALGPQHLAFEVVRTEYQDWKSRIKAAGIPIIHEQTWRGTFESFYFHDPDGHVLEIVEEGMWD